jgi:hypothetical protein
VCHACMRHYLLIANQTLDTSTLRTWVLGEVAASRTRCHVHVVAPATRVGTAFTWTEGEARAAARQRLDNVLPWMRSLGVRAEGEVGDENPVLAAADALLERPYDEVVVSTLPAGVSRWLKADVIHRVRRIALVPVTHIEDLEAALPWRRLPVPGAAAVTLALVASALLAR